MKREELIDTEPPQEDVGGVYGYQEYLAAIADPQHEEHERFMEWNGSFIAENIGTDETMGRMR